MMFTAIFLINFLIGIFCEVYAEVMGEEAPEGKVSTMCAHKDQIYTLRKDTQRYAILGIHGGHGRGSSRLQDKPFLVM